MVIYGPHENADYDDDLGPVIVEDWYHEDYYDLVEQAMAPISKSIGPPVSTNNLINGKMNVLLPEVYYTYRYVTDLRCSIPVSTRPVIHAFQMLASLNSSSSQERPIAYV